MDALETYLDYSELLANAAMPRSLDRRDAKMHT
jgi:hypothetical protein